MQVFKALLFSAILLCAYASEESLRDLTVTVTPAAAVTATAAAVTATAAVDSATALASYTLKCTQTKRTTDADCFNIKPDAAASGYKCCVNEYEALGVKLSLCIIQSTTATTTNAGVSSVASMVVRCSSNLLKVVGLFVAGLMMLF